MDSLWVVALQIPNLMRRQSGMGDAMVGFILWMCGGGLLIAIGIAAFFARKEVGFFANVRTLPMEDVKAYNRAVGKLFLVYGAVFMLLGIPLLYGNSPAIIISILGVMAETIAAMAVYILAIQSRYEKKDGKG